MKTQYTTRVAKAITVFFLGIVAVRGADLRYLSSLADSVVVGTVETRMESPTNLTFDLAIQRVLKGSDQLIGSTVRVNHPWANKNLATPSSISLDWEAKGIWFLARGESGWDVMPVQGLDGIFGFLFLPARVTGERQYTYEPSASAVDKVVYEMADGLFAEGADPLFKMLLLAYASTPATDRVLNDLLQSENLSLRAGALVGLLTNGKVVALQPLPQIWASADSNQRSFIVHAISSYFRNTSSEAVSELVSIAQDSTTDSELRKAVVRSLRSIHTKQTLPFFAARLASEDAGEQMNALVAISSFVNGCPPQTPYNVASMEYMKFKYPSAFRSKETMDRLVIGGEGEDQRLPAMLAFWTAWWAKNGTAVLSAK